MIKVVFSAPDTFKVQRLRVGTWLTIAEVSTMEQAEWMVGKLGEEEHPKSLRTRPRRAAALYLKGGGDAP